MAQLGGIVMLDPEGPSKEQFFFGGIEKCRFKKPVVPGDTLVSTVYTSTNPCAENSRSQTYRKHKRSGFKRACGSWCKDT